MTPQERTARLEGLLERVRRRAAEPRPARAAAPSAATVAAPFAVPAPSPVPVAAAPSPVPPPMPAPSASFDQTVEELLEAPIPLVQPSHTAKEPAQVQAISMEPPPPAPAQFQSLSPAGEAEEAPIPLVTSVTTPGAVHTAEELEAEELGEDDLISVPPEPRESAPPPAVSAAQQDELDFDEPEEAAEEVPASSKRPIAGSLDEALAGVSDLGSEPEAPLQTPPPESGPQEAMPPAAALEAPRVPDMGESLEAEIGAPVDLGPTPEQLGETIELPEPSRARLELDVAVPPAPEQEAPPVSEELEVALPRRESIGAYDAGLAPPADAREELRRYEEQAAEQPANVEAAAAPPMPMEASGIISRPELSGVTVSRFANEARNFTPASFIELLDASLRLGSE